MTGTSLSIIIAISNFRLRKNTEQKSETITESGEWFGLLLFGTPERIRIPDLLVRSQTLYPAELQAHLHANALSYVSTTDEKTQAKFTQSYCTVLQATWHVDGSRC